MAPDRRRTSRCDCGTRRITWSTWRPQPDQVVFEQGTRGDGLYVVLDGGLDVAVINAGIFPDRAPVVDGDLLAWRRTLDVNLFGALFVIPMEDGDEGAACPQPFFALVGSMTDDSSVKASAAGRATAWPKPPLLRRRR